ncbi:MAG: hypothetical protein WA816_04060 [Bacteroidales bacterium]
MKPIGIFSYIIFLIISFQSLQGQKSHIKDNVDLTTSEVCLTGELFTPDFIVDGSTYFNSEWLLGDIYLSDGEVSRNKLIKYNGLLDELFWQEPKSKNIIKLDKEAILQFHFQNFNGDQTVYFKKIKFKRNSISDSSEVFGQVVNEGKLSLYILHTYKTSGTEIMRQNGNLLERTIYVEEPVYVFMLTNNKTFVFKSLNRKKLCSISPVNFEKIKEFLKTNRTETIKDVSYLRKLTQFLSTIVN